MIVFLEIRTNLVIVRARAENDDGVLGDMVQHVEPGQKLQLDETNLTYDDLIKHGNGEMIGNRLANPIFSR